MGQHIVDPGPSKKGLISDTTCLGLGKSTWLSIYNLIKAEELEITTVQATADSTRKYDATLKDLADCYLHRIATREKILPYTDVDAQIDPKLLQKWQQFDSIISNLESSKEAETSKMANT